jgi:hypothetical protein
LRKIQDAIRVVLDSEGTRLANSVETIRVQSSIGTLSIFPNEKYFTRKDAPGDKRKQYLTLYAFDRCNGQIEVHETISAATGAYLLLAIQIAPIQNARNLNPIHCT